jgi:hypothetical protein
MFCTQVTLKDQQYDDAIDDLNEQWGQLRHQRNLNYQTLLRQEEAAGETPPD